MVFASPLRQFYRDRTTRSRLPGFSHLENFTVKRNLHPSTGTLQKPCQRLTQTATTHTTGPLVSSALFLLSRRICNEAGSKRTSQESFHMIIKFPILSHRAMPALDCKSPAPATNKDGMCYCLRPMKALFPLEALCNWPAIASSRHVFCS